MRFVQLSGLVGSLRFRLTAWNTAVVLTTVIVTLLGVREGLRLALLAEFDNLLLDDTEEITLTLKRYYPRLSDVFDEMDRKALGHKDHRLFAQLFDADGLNLHSTKHTPQFDEGGAPDARKKPVFVSQGSYRFVERRVVQPGLPLYTLRVGSSLESIDNDVAQVTGLMTAAGVVMLFVAPLGGYWLAQRATGPIRGIINTAARLRPSHMEERLPIRGAGDELDQLSRTINRFLDLIADYLDRNREFVANAAHELRSPLAAIQSSVEVTLNSERTIGEYQDQLDEIADQCGHLSVLVNQLLLLAETDVARFEVKRRPVELKRLVEKSLDMFRGAAEEAGVELIGQRLEEISLLADSDRLRQVINNLIDNSLKYTPRGGAVRVALFRDSASRQAVFTVADSGMGIHPDDLPHVFERFFRADKSRQHVDETRGNGLGLSICQAIVQAHNGQIQVQSELGHGAMFSVMLPLDQSEETHLEIGKQISFVP